ncbi:MAG: anthrone oxygenase family protein [Ilumatobacteraceae bacterium]
MLHRSLASLTTIAAIGAAVAGGVFFGFSTFIMRALNRLPADRAIAAMQAINLVAPNPLFMTALFGTGAACAIVGVVSLRHFDEPGAVHRVVGAGVYIAGLLVTVAYHVPHNDALARVDPNGLGAVRTWARYATGWTAWNHVRAATAIAGAVLLVVANRVADRATAM